MRTNDEEMVACLDLSRNFSKCKRELMSVGLLGILIILLYSAVFLRNNLLNLRKSHRDFLWKRRFFLFSVGGGAISISSTIVFVVVYTSASYKMVGMVEFKKNIFYAKLLISYFCGIIFIFSQKFFFRLQSRKEGDKNFLCVSNNREVFSSAFAMGLWLPILVGAVIEFYYSEYNLFPGVYFEDNTEYKEYIVKYDEIIYGISEIASICLWINLFKFSSFNFMVTGKKEIIVSTLTSVILLSVIFLEVFVREMRMYFVFPLILALASYFSLRVETKFNLDAEGR